MTTIHVDGDACPVREEVFRVASRLGLPVVVAEGADAADDWIAERIGRGDVCVTADIPLAARCLERGARAISPRGRPWTTDNIGGALAGRAVARGLREAGVATRGPPTPTPPR